MTMTNSQPNKQNSDQHLDVITYNKNALNNLRRAIVLGQGQFSLILARANYQRLQRLLIEESRKSLQLYHVVIPPDAVSLRAVIEAVTSPVSPPEPPGDLPTESLVESLVEPPAESPELPAESLTEPLQEPPAEQTQAAMLTGLEKISTAQKEGGASPIERLLKSANLGRDELPKRFPYPVVLWVNDSVLQQLNRYAPDLKSFAATPIRFEYPAPALIAVLRAQAVDTFTQILDVDTGVVLNNRLPLSASITEPLAVRELTFALDQLEHLPAAQTDLVTNSLLADLLFLQGRSLHQQGDLSRAKSYYEKSLIHWQLEAADEAAGAARSTSRKGGAGLKSRDKQAVLRFHLGLWWQSQAVLEKDPTRAYQQARAHFEGCLTIFRQQNRADRIGRFMLALAEVVQKLEDWPALRQVAQEGTRLHHSDPARLARDYGYLAEVAIARYQKDAQPSLLSEAQGFAQQALETSDLVLQGGPSLAGPSPADTLATGTSATGTSAADSEASLASKIALRYHRGCYFYLLAIAYQLQGQNKRAVEHLERTLQNVDPYYDLSLYRRTLSRLWRLYFDHQHYAEAFEIKLEQRRVETLFGLRAFIGASQIRSFSVRSPSASTDNHSKLPGSTTQTVLSAAIKASGRTKDIEALVARLSQPRYPLVAIHGQSGVGKSSLLRAGLVPRLRNLISGGRTTLPVLIGSYSSDWIQQIYGALKSQIKSQIKSHNRSAFETIDKATDETSISPVDRIADEAEDSPKQLLEALIEALRQLTSQQYQQVVLIFDQFEDFFYEYPTFKARKGLYLFLQACLDLSDVKVVLALREDFLHYLLEWDRNADLSIINHDILSKDVRYYLGNFTPNAAESLIHQLTQAAGFELEPGLIAALVDDLAEETGEVRPIELQVVGAQLQRENITTLAQYSHLGRSPKAQLLKNFLDSVVQDCGPENNAVARSVLYLLSEGDNRPLKSLAELQEPLLIAHIDTAPQQLSLVLDILIGSGLVFEVPEVSGVRYQLVHEYLASLVQDRQQPGLIEVLHAERNRRQLTEDQLQKALAAQSDSWQQTTIARQRAQAAEIKALISVARSLYLSGEGINALTKALRAAQQMQSIEDVLLQRQVALCLATSVRSIHEKNELTGHRNWVLAVDCRPDGRSDSKAQLPNSADLPASANLPATIVSASEDGTVKLWSNSGVLLQTLSGHQAGVLDVRFSPDGQYLASASLDHTIRLWRADGEFVRLFDLGAASVTSISFSPTAPLLAATYSDTTVRLWTLEGDYVRSLEGHEDWARTVAFSPDGQRLATGGEDNTVRLWSVEGELLDTLYGHRGWVRSVAFSPDGRQIVSAGDENALRLWSADGYKLDTLYAHDDWVRSVAFSPNGRYIASASDDQTICIWALDGSVLHRFNHRSSVHSVTWSADSASVVSGGDDDQVHIWRLAGPSVHLCEGHKGIVWSARWRPASRIAVNQTATSQIAANQATASQTTANQTTQEKPELAQTGLQPVSILSAGGDSAIRLWSESGQLLQSVEGHRRGVHCADWRPDGQFFASASADYSVRIWRADGALVRTLAGHGDAVWQVRYSPDGEKLVSVSSDRTVRLWSHTGQMLQTWSDHTDTVWHASFSPDGQYIVSASEDNTLRLWHYQDGLVQTLNQPDSVWCASFDPHARFVASGGADGVIRLWPVVEASQDSGEPSLRLSTESIGLQGHRDWVRSLCFSPDGQFLASASDDGTVRLWSLADEAIGTSEVLNAESETAQLLPPLKEHEGVVWDVDFDHTGERLISAGADGTVRIWDLRLDALRMQGCAWLQDWLSARPDMKRQLCQELKA